VDLRLSPALCITTVPARVISIRVPCELTARRVLAIEVASKIELRRSRCPVGIFLLNGSLLVVARRAIRKDEPTALSRALGFLHSEYQTAFFWWEMMEFARRFLLVGLFIIFPYQQGTIMQVAVANVTAMVYLV
jgi:hypothetical protein